jgi:hypothetical protein
VGVNLVLISREENRLRGFEHRALKKTFEPKREELTGDWTKLHKEELHAVLFKISCDQVQEDERGR